MNPADTLRESSDLIVSGNEAPLVEHAQAVLERAVAAGNGRRPGVTLTYAQSLDGCISAAIGVATPISNTQSRVFTHRLRAMHDAILIGVNTVVVDDPQLNVREVEGSDPIPVVVDSSLRTPVQARLLRRKGVQPIIATVEGASEQRESELVEAGALVLRLPAGAGGGVDLPSMFASLCRQGIRSVMVEGGARIITSVLKEQLADQLVVTISPMLLGGVRGVGCMGEMMPALRPRLTNMHCQPAGCDLMVQGEIERAAG